MSDTITLWTSARNGLDDVLIKLLKEGENVNALDAKGRTPLHHAAIGGREKAAKLLIDAGADINVRDSENMTPLARAIASGHNELRPLFK